MVVYISLFAVSVILGLLMTGKNPTKLKKIIYLSILFVLMFVVTVMRYGVGNDYFSYIRIFERINDTPWSDILGLEFEPLFSVVTKLISMVTGNYEVMYGIYSVLILVPVAYSIYRHSDIPWLSVTTYLCFTFFYTSLSFIRQSIAVSVLILAYGFIKKRKLVPVLIFAVIATLFHYTALVFIPFYLLAHFLKPTKKSVIIYSSVSVGLLVICLIMKAAGANPLDLAAQLVTAVTGKDYTGYVGSAWFELGFGVEYLIMPLAFTLFAVISYFLGWKEKEDSDILLWFTLSNASIWSFITYAFIVERFSMFVFIFSLFTVPSIINYYFEKARKVEEEEKKNKEISKKIPGYSKKKAEEKSDNAFLITVAVTICMFVYNCWSIYKNFHGIYPYGCMIPAVHDVLDGDNDPEENYYEDMYVNADLYTYLIQLKNTDFSYAIVSTSDDYDGLLTGIRRAADYTGTGINRDAESEAKSPFFIEYNNRNGEVFVNETSGPEISYTSENGAVITCNNEVGTVTDAEGKTAQVTGDMIMFVLFDDNGLIFDATEYGIDQVMRDAAKVKIN